jgi:hypothetical protein
MRITSIYDVGDKVTIDSDKAIVGVIIAMTVRDVGKNILYEVSWMCGDLKSAWVEEWRLDRWEE